MGPIAHAVGHGAAHLLKHFFEKYEKTQKAEAERLQRMREYRPLSEFEGFSDCTVPGKGFILITNLELYNKRRRI